MHIRHEASHCLFGGELAGQSQRSVGHAVIRSAKGEYRAPPGCAFDQLDGGLHRIRTGWPTELDARVGRECHRQTPQNLLDELIFDRRGEIQGLQRDPLGKQTLNGLHHHRMMMTQAQRPSAG
jgi:hypothetical protein